ncbi:hypothetical protein DM860_017922 [Cuscuta australis]|uniref:cytokinin riboside 5'-monophosphate phosphoribohydrolase n=1 Tax=Cuscuta australis TaxID=267555 RepID=A0A328DYK3_9ASTE|nr:hypothetical protein DM860_017922 [Cuscuta australis]
MEGTSRTLPYTIRFVGLLGSHSLGRNPKFMATAVDLGRELLRRRISLAYGGGNVGLQGAVASTVFTSGALVRGFIPGFIATRRIYGPTYGVEHTVSSNYYKYFEMNHAVEAFIILPGGVDTMEGLFTLISWASKGLHNRPIGLLSTDGYFNNLLKFLDDAVRQNFMALNQRKLFISSFFVDELLDKLEFAKAFPGPEGRFEVKESGSQGEPAMGGLYHRWEESDFFQNPSSHRWVLFPSMEPSHPSMGTSSHRWVFDIAGPDTKMTKLWMIADSTFWKKSGNRDGAGPSRAPAKASLQSVANTLNRLTLKVDGMGQSIERMDWTLQRQHHDMMAYFRGVNYVPPPFDSTILGQNFEGEDDDSYATSSSPDEADFEDAVDGDLMDVEDDEDDDDEEDEDADA